MALTILIATPVGCALFLIPLPFYIFGPGAAVSLNAAITVPKHTPPPGEMYLTAVDVIAGRPVSYAVAKVLPGFEIVPRGQVAPPSMSDAQFNRELGDEMQQSQQTASIVAERAAGLPVKARQSFIVFNTIAHSPGGECLRRGDRITALDGRPLSGPNALLDATGSRPAGTKFRLLVNRNGANVNVRCRTFLYRRHARFGITVVPRTEVYSLPVHVTFNIPNVNGSSAGLMFALQIYRTLTGRSLGGVRRIAGTGVLTADGTVTPVEGVPEKVRAAVKAGATVFLIPKQNYKDVRSRDGLTILPVTSFHSAVKALDALAIQ